MNKELNDEHPSHTYIYKLLSAFDFVSIYQSLPTFEESVPPLLTAVHQLNDSSVCFISPVAYIFELGTTGALSSNPFSCPVLAYMHNSWQNGIPRRGSNERALFLVCTWHQHRPSWYLRFNYKGWEEEQSWRVEVCGLRMDMLNSFPLFSMLFVPQSWKNFFIMQSGKWKY